MDTNQTLTKIKDWLEEEVQDKDLVGESGVADIIIGRIECAECLLKQIRKWEDDE
jgi:hypothetical protein